jgi:hypothetical protein
VAAGFPAARVAPAAGVRLTAGLGLGAEEHAASNSAIPTPESAAHAARRRPRSIGKLIGVRVFLRFMTISIGFEAKGLIGRGPPLAIPRPGIASGRDRDD